jgi:hypothetical protein
MHFNLKLKRNATAIAVVATAAFAGGAYAATQSSQTSPRQAFLNDAAKRLKVTPSQLTGALQGALFDQLQAAVAAGKLTQAQADMIKKHVKSEPGEPGFFAHPGFGFHGLHRGFALPAPGFGAAGPGHGGRIDAAATYLGITRQQLLDQLAGGKSLAQIAKGRGKSASGLKAAMLAAIHTRLDRAVSSKLITAAQEQQILSRLPARLDAEINQAGFRPPRRGFLFRGPGGRLFHGPDGRSGMGPGGYGGGPGGGPMMPPPGPAGLAAPPPGVPGPAY